VKLSPSKHQPTVRLTRKNLQDGFYIGGSSYRRGNRLDAERWRCSLDHGHEIFGVRSGVGIEYDSNPREARRSFFEQTEPFATGREFKIAKAGEITTRLPHAEGARMA
jgi:hypothetical protein